jgi:uncharacterized membrane protein
MAMWLKTLLGQCAYLSKVSGSTLSDFRRNFYNSPHRFRKKTMKENAFRGAAMGNNIISYRMVLYVLFLGVLLLSLSPCLQAQTYYADLVITVDSSGYVTIEGQTNYPNLTIQNTEQYTSKTQHLWVLNISKQQIFSEFLYTLILPEGSSITYIKSSGVIRIEESLGRLVIKGFGENEFLTILAQYQIEKREQSLLQQTLVYISLFSGIIIVSLLLVFQVFKEKNSKVVVEASGDRQKPYEEIQGLNQRQQQIMQLLHQSTTPLTQTDIQKQLQIPKASVSRNILRLERKGLIEKEQIGMSNLIRLKKP